MFTRTRYQEGSLTTEKRKTGPDVWVYRWRDTEQDGQRAKRKVRVGTKAEFPNKRDAIRAVANLKLGINAEALTSKKKSFTVADLWSHYEETELSTDRLQASTKAVYRQYYKQHIQPVWGTYRLGDVRAMPVERWLGGLSYAAGTKAKIRNLLSGLYQHALRQEWVDRNPIRDVRQGAKRGGEPDILEPSEMQHLIRHLPEPCRTMALIAALTGLRVSEIIGLQWRDVDLASGTFQLQRGVVNQEVTALKTAGSARLLPIPSAVIEALTAWRETSLFRSTDHWVFASARTNGAQPYWPGTLLTKVLQPTARGLGITKRVGWHTFRRSFATLLLGSGATVKTTQELMRHATPHVTLGVYAQAVNAEKREAQDNIAALIFDPKREFLETSA